MSSLPLVALSSPPVPLVLQTERHGGTIQNAMGFGLAQDAAAADKLAAALQRASMDLFTTAAAFAAGADAAVKRGDVNAAVLREPDMARVRAVVEQGTGKLTPEAMLTLISGRLMKALDTGSLQDMRQRLSAYQSRMAVRSSQGERLSAALDAALKAAEQAGSAADAAAAEAGAQEGSVRLAREHVERLQAELEAMQPDDPDRAARQAQLETAQQHLHSAQVRLEKASHVLVEASMQFERALGQVEKERGRVEVFGVPGQPTEKPEQRSSSAAATLQKLIAQLSILSADVSLEKMKNETEALMAALKAREAENLERSRKFEAEQQRARDAESKTGCAGKILKWVSAAVSVVVVAVGVLTFNPAIIAVGVVGMLMTVDSMIGSATGFSVMGKLTELVGKGISSALTAFGVPESLARQIGDIAAVVVVAVAVIAMMMVAGNVGGALQAVNGVQNVTRLMDAARQAVEVLQVIGQLVSTAASITVGVGQIIVAGILVDVARLLAAMEESIFGSEVLRDLLDKVRESADALYRTSLDLVRKMGEVIQDNTETGKAIIAHTRAHA